MNCPLCQNTKVLRFFEGEDRIYHQCRRCGLVYVPKSYHLSPSRERARYEEHQNFPGDPAYRGFLSRLVTPLLGELRPGWRGLDFGCGPGPTLSVMMKEQGYAMDLYDPFFAPGLERLRGPYQFIVATETAEHLRNPRGTFTLLDHFLEKGGLLALMTQFFEEEMDFSRWYYRRDPTHIAFYGKRTFNWMAGYWGWELKFPVPNVCFFRKPC